MRTAPRTVNGAPAHSAHGAPPQDRHAPVTPEAPRCPSCGRNFVDGLTGVLDRQAWENRALAALARAREERRPLALVLADLDRFKSVNDTYGHVAGDEVLKATAEVLGRIEGAVVGRYGGHTGDEFLVLLPHSGVDAARRAAGRALEAVRGRTIGVRTSRNASVALTGQTVSMGVAGRVPLGRPEDELFDLLLDCDVALRAAKRAGGDQVREALPALGARCRRAEPDRPGRTPARTEGGAERPRQVRIPLAALGHTAQQDGTELVLSVASATHLRDILGRLLDEVPEAPRSG
ncbi:GGDEF domain-containing protein [Streptomyces chumphonensis]|uniref:GGDEF domain-containing protein n=1 Tax=Streptomyces chumphonensis TaxID=1214925 RepID=UPI003D755578